MAPSDDDRDGRHALARGYVLAGRVMSVGLQMALPAGGGWWLDQRFATTPWWTILGVVLGFSTGMLELLKLAKDIGDKGSRR
jgi:F0F1-type ATP synthase assembly protein I